MSKYVVTTVKLDSELYSRFKEINVRTKISLQEFVNKCMDTYIVNEQFRNEVSESIVKNADLSQSQPVSVTGGSESFPFLSCENQNTQSEEFTQNINGEEI